MRQLILILFGLLVHLSAEAQTPATITLKELEQRMQFKSEDVLVVNFWATWCAPCVKELPLFEKLQKEHPTGIKVLLVSMDLDLDPNPEKVYKFVQRKQLQSEVALLNEKDPNSWIERIDKSWSGALPATVIINQKSGYKKFVERQLHDGDLEKLIEEVKTN